MIAKTCACLCCGVNLCIDTFVIGQDTTICRSCAAYCGIIRKSVGIRRKTTCIVAVCNGTLTFKTAAASSTTGFAHTAAATGKQDNMILSDLRCRIVLRFFSIGIIVCSFSCLVHCPSIDSYIGSAAASAENMIAVGLTVVFIRKPCSIPINLTTAAAKGAVCRPVTTSFTQIDVDGLTCTQMNRSLGLTAAPRRAIALVFTFACTTVRTVCSDSIVAVIRCSKCLYKSVIGCECKSINNEVKLIIRIRWTHFIKTYSGSTEFLLQYIFLSLFVEYFFVLNELLVFICNRIIDSSQYIRINAIIKGQRFIIGVITAGRYIPSGKIQRIIAGKCNRDTDAVSVGDSGYNRISGIFYGNIICFCAKISSNRVFIGRFQPLRLEDAAVFIERYSYGSNGLTFCCFRAGIVLLNCILYCLFLCVCFVPLTV